MDLDRSLLFSRLPRAALPAVAATGLFFSTPGSAVRAQGAPIAVWVNTDEKVTRDELRLSRDGASVANAVWDGHGVHLFGGRNEVVNFNVVLEAPGGSTDVSVSFNLLTGPGGAAIGSRSATGDGVFDFTGRNIELFFVRYLQIKGLSNVSYGFYDERHVPSKLQRPWSGNGVGVGGWQDRPNHDKFYPDIAVPLELVPTFDIPPASNQSIWVDVYVPRSSPPGMYTGTFVVRSGGTIVQSIPVELQVYAFTLPDVPASKTMLFVSSKNINRRYMGSGYIDYRSPEAAQAKRIRDRHFLVAHRHKISLIGDDPDDCGVVADEPCAEWEQRLSGSLFTAANGYEGPGAGIGNGIYSIATYGSWPRDQWNQAAMHQHTDNWAAWFAAHAPDTDVIFYLCDESDCPGFNGVETWAQWILNNPGPGRAIKSFATVALPDAAAQIPSLDIAASTLTVGIPSQWQPAADRYTSDSRHGFYMYNGHRPASGSFATEDDGVALRELAWGQYKKRITRWFFWEGTYYSDYQNSRAESDLFRRALTFGREPNSVTSSGEIYRDPQGNAGVYGVGDGLLFYPGSDRLFPQSSYSVAGPFASLRLKYWRRGIQDVDYLTLAAAVNAPAVQQLLSEMVPEVLWEYGVADANDPTWVRKDISWPVDPNRWEDARRRLAEIITGSGSGDATPGHLSLSSAIVLTPSTPSVNEATVARFAATNDGGQPITVQYFLAGARDANGANVDFPTTGPMTIQPGEVFSYQGSRSFAVSGSSQVWPAYFDGTNWIELAAHTPFTVAPAMPERIEENGPGVLQGPTAWAAGTDGRASGGRYVASSVANSSVTLTFTGTGISWIGIADGCSGQAVVDVDGVSASVDAYRASGGGWQQVLFTKTGLPNGSHTFALRVLGTKQAASCGPWIYVDAFEIY